MHATALENAERFFKTYRIEGAGRVLDIGSQDVNGSLRSVCPHRYTGVDFVSGPGVDVVLDGPYKLPMPDESVDIVVSSSCFEHSEFFWLLFRDILRVLKPAGLFYLSAPSNGDIHRFPVDCWRFYPDAAVRLSAKWGRRNGYNSCTLESYTSKRKGSVWNDYVGVFLKDERFIHQYPLRITDSFGDFMNSDDGGNATTYTEDQSSILWKWRRMAYFLKTPGAGPRAIQIVFEIVMGKRRRIFPDS